MATHQALTGLAGPNAGLRAVSDIVAAEHPSLQHA